MVEELKTEEKHCDEGGKDSEKRVRYLGERRVFMKRFKEKFENVIVSLAGFGIVGAQACM